MEGKEIRTEDTHRFVFPDGLINPYGMNMVGGTQSMIAIFKVGKNVYFRNMEPESRTKVSFLMRWQDLLDRIEQIKSLPDWTHDDVITMSIGLNDSVPQLRPEKGSIRKLGTLDNFVEGLK